MRKVSTDELITELQECFEKHGEINRRIFNDDGEFHSGKTIYNRFDSFSNACDEAGVPHNNKPQEKKRVEIKCNSCGNIREVYPYRAEKEFPDGTSQSCKKCMDKKKKVSCSWCGKVLTRHKYRAEESENFFCNDKCLGSWRSENVVGENHPRYDEKCTDKYGENWSSIREGAIQRDNKECQDCGISREKHLSEKNIDLDVHHIKPRKEFIENNMSIEDANEMDNLETLCRSCHMTREWSQ